MKTAPLIRIYRTGAIPERVEREHGHAGKWLVDAMQRTPQYQAGNLRLEVRDATAFEFDGAEDADAFIVSGNFDGTASAATPPDAEGKAAARAKRPQWINALGEHIVEHAEEGDPVLGVCFGLQIMTEAFGGRVTLNEQGWELGTIEHRVADASASAHWVMKDVPEHFDMNQYHSDVGVEVENIPGGRILASSEKTGNQIFAVERGNVDVAAIQGHPETNRRMARQLTDIVLDGLEPEARAELAREVDVRDTPVTQKFFDNFADHVVDVMAERDFDDT